MSSAIIEFFPINVNTTAIRKDQTKQHAHCSALTRSILTQKTIDITMIYGK